MSGRVVVEEHPHQWAYRPAAGESTRGRWVCEHVNADTSPCRTVVADLGFIPGPSVGVHYYTTMEEVR